MCANCFFDQGVFSQITVFISLYQRELIHQIVNHVAILILLCQYVLFGLCRPYVADSLIMPRVQGRAAKKLKKRREQRRLEREAAKSNKASANSITSVTQYFLNVAEEIEATNPSIASNVEAAKEDTAATTVSRTNNANGDTKHSFVVSVTNNTSSQSTVGSCGGSCSCDIKLSPSVAKFSAALSALDNHSAAVEAPPSAEHTNQAALEAMHPRLKANTSHLSLLKPTQIFETSTAKLSPESTSLVEAIEKKIKRTPAAKQRLLFSGIKEAFIRDEEPLPLPKVAPTGPSLDMNAFIILLRTLLEYLKHGETSHARNTMLPWLPIPNQTARH